MGSSASTTTTSRIVTKFIMLLSFWSPLLLNCLLLSQPTILVHAKSVGGSLDSGARVLVQAPVDLGDLLLDYDRKVRPNYGYGPVEVRTNLMIDRAAWHKQTVRVDLYWRTEWTDSRLQFRPTKISSSSSRSLHNNELKSNSKSELDLSTKNKMKKENEITMQRKDEKMMVEDIDYSSSTGGDRVTVSPEDTGKLWTPDLYFSNAAGDTKLLNAGSTAFNANGKVEQNKHYRVTLPCPLNVTEIASGRNPAGHCNATLSIESYGFDRRDLSLDWSGPSFAAAEKASSATLMTASPAITWITQTDTKNTILSSRSTKTLYSSTSSAAEFERLQAGFTIRTGVTPEIIQYIVNKELGQTEL